MKEVYHKLEYLDKSIFEQLNHIVEEWHKGNKRDREFMSFEQRVHKALADIESRIVGDALKDLDIDHKEIEVGGIAYQKAYCLPQTYCGLSGEFKIERNLYTPVEGNNRSICPLEYRAGIIERRWTPAAGELLAYSVAIMTPYEAERLFKKFGGMSPSRSSLDRFPKDLSVKWEENRTLWEEAIRSQESLPQDSITIAVSLDGVMVPMKDGKRLEKRAQALKKGKETRGPAGCREASCGTVSFYDKEGQRLHTIYHGRMPESKKVKLHTQLDNELRSLLPIIHPLNISLIADGAPDNWRIFSEIIDKCIKDGIPLDSINIYKVVDFFHGCEHLKKALDLYYGEKSIKSRSNYEKLRIILRDEKGGVESIIKKITYFRNRRKGSRRKKLTTELKYFRKRRKFMDYAKYKRLNLPIGSGVVEAACKTLVTQRLKRSGMRWENEGGQSVLTLRSLLRSERWDLGWNLLANSYKCKIRMVKRNGHLTLLQDIDEAA